MFLKTAISSLEDLLYYFKTHPVYTAKSIRFSIIKKFCTKMSIVKLCRFLEVSRSGYYKWLHRMEKGNCDEIILNRIIEIQNKHHDTLGYRRMQRELAKSSIFIGESKTYRIMRKYGRLSKALYTKKNVIINHAIHTYRNQLKGNFSAFMPNLKWCIDISKIDTNEGRLYLYVIIDLYDRYVVKHRLYKSQKTHLVKRIIQDALNKERIDDNIPILIHSDQGVQFSNNQYNNFIKKNNINASMSAKGTPTDNAVIESFFATLKLECIYRNTLDTQKTSEKLINEFIHYYNNIRIQSKTSLTPSEIRRLA